MSSSKKPKPPEKIADRFEVHNKLGSGCFGDVYKGTNIETKESVAIKFEGKSVEVPQLKHEATILGILNPDNGPDAIGFAFCHFSGIEGAYSVLVMPLMSRSLEDCVQKCKGTLGVKTSLSIADQLLKRLEYLHSKCFVHRDIKPENFMWGFGEKQNVLHMIDFGLSKKYYDSKGHIGFKENRSLTGTARYASIAVHLGHEQGRRDDLEAIGHMLLYFLRGSLPWSGLEAKTKEEKYRKICETKKNTKLEDLCKGFPSAFSKYLDHARNLKFTDRPDYVALRKLFSDEFASSGFVEDFNFEWFKGQKPPLMELPEWSAPTQPDDKSKTQARQAAPSQTTATTASTNVAKTSTCCTLM